MATEATKTYRAQVESLIARVLAAGEADERACLVDELVGLIVSDYLEDSENHDFVERSGFDDYLEKAVEEYCERELPDFDDFVKKEDSLEEAIDWRSVIRENDIAEMDDLENYVENDELEDAFEVLVKDKRLVNGKDVDDAVDALRDTLRLEIGVLRRQTEALELVNRRCLLGRLKWLLLGR